MNFVAAQRDMARAFAGGAPGVLVSGIAWLAAGVIWLRSDVLSGFYALFFGDMLIFPASVLISRLALGAPKLAGSNPLELLVLETTFMLFGGLLIAWLLLRPAPDLVFPVMAITIGVRYFAFRTLYADLLFWLLGTALVAIGVIAALRLVVLPLNISVIAGLIEIGFAGLLLLGRRGHVR